MASTCTSGLLFIFFILVVGRESVLSATGGREMRCGRRLVSGLFSRPRLPLGYSYVTTVPRGACRLNVSELVSTENYIALKITNGSYIMNGEFAVSAPGSYETAGARFLYTRVGGLDNVFALGPIHHPVDIMILYTQPNPSIKYEYFTESLNGEDVETVTRPDIVIPSINVSKHTRRHHSFESIPRSGAGISRHPDIVSMSKDISSGEDKTEENVVGKRRFSWKVLSYTQCTRTCGGGIQIGKYRCVETNANGFDREVSPIHCSGLAPVGRRRRCGNSPCPPRWRAAAWSACPRCGPATRTRIVGCVQDHSRGITKISDQKCPPLKPSTTEQCDIPICGNLDSGVSRQIQTKRVRPREHTDTFREGPVYTVAVNRTDFDIGPEYSFSATAGWLYTEWSECVGWCVGEGIQTRGVRCADPAGCAPRKDLGKTQSCTPKLTCEPMDGQWFTGEWSHCSSNCGGKQVRGVLCIGGSGRHLRDSACKGPRPEHERDCGTECPPTWYYSDWGQCTGSCSSEITAGVQKRSVVCLRGISTTADSAESDAECASLRPHAIQTCEPHCATVSTLSPPLTIESQKSFGYETTSANTQRAPAIRETEKRDNEDCEDKLNNCFLAVQARLCHYNFYVQNCCNSCKGR